MKNKESKNQKEEIKNERVLVYVRVRPFSEEELIKDSTTPIEQIDEKWNNNCIWSNRNRKNIWQETLKMKKKKE